jgi:hypothetical protein
MQIQFLSRLLATGFLLTLFGCGETASRKEAADEAVVKRELAEFPSATRMLLGEFQAQLKPLISIPVAAPTDGDILFHVDQPRQMLGKDMLWAEVEPRQIAGEERQLELNTRNEQLRLREELHNNALEIERVEFMLNDPDLRELPYADRIPISTNIVEQLRGERALLMEQLAACGEVERLAFEQKSLRSRLKMPFDGELLVYLPVSDMRAEFRVAANTPIGIMRDISELYLHIVIRDPQIVGIPPEQLSVKFSRDTGTVFNGRFHDTQIAELQKQDVLVYRFVFSSGFNAELATLIGANLTCELWVDSDRPFHAVPKLEVARMLAEKESYSGWPEAVENLWPYSELLYSGRTHLGIVSKDGE